MLEETQITCPFCWEQLTVLLDLSIPEQEYIEDCQVCCQAITLSYTSVDGILGTISADRSDG
jgi:hypothetical protein